MKIKGAEGNSSQPETLRSSQKDPQVDMVAKLYEKQFLREMVKAMRQTVSFGELTKPSMAEGIFQSQLDEQYVETWGEKGGIGLGDVIYDALMNRFFNRGTTKSSPRSPPVVPHGPGARVNARLPQKGNNVLMEVRLPDAPEARKVQVPWSGILLAKDRSEGWTSALLDHGEGLQSTFRFRGVLNPDVGLGQSLAKGQIFGVLDPEAHSFFWNLMQNSSI